MTVKKILIGSVLMLFGWFLAAYPVSAAGEVDADRVEAKVMDMNRVRELALNSWEARRAEL